MAIQVRLRTAFPGLAVGTLMTQTNPGEAFWDAGRTLWLSPAMVAERDDLVDADIPTSATYYYVDDSGIARSKAWADSALDRARRSIGNLFLAQARAQRAALLFRDMLARRIE